MLIDPWDSHQYKDYKRLRDEFGIEELKTNLDHKLFRRGVVFGHRGFEYISDAIDNKRKYVVLTGLMPSGKMHLGHKMVIDQVIYHQKLGADIFVAIADIEAYATRNISLKKCRELAINEYVKNYIALGLKSENSQIYFQSLRDDVKTLAYLLSKKTNLSEMRGTYGFSDSTNMAHVSSPLIQFADILHVQMEKYGGPRPTIVPVGIDQDPHLRLTREISRRFRLFNIKMVDETIGIFVKSDDNVKMLLKLAEEKLSQNFSDFEKKESYKALYIKDAKKTDIMNIDHLLIDLEKEQSENIFYAPSSSYHRFMTGLTGDKMSSSQPETAIFLSDDEKDVKKKVMSAKTGGGVTLEDHKEHGGKPEECSIYELFMYHLIEDDSHLKEIYETCKDGNRSCGQCKKEGADLLCKFLKELSEKRESCEDIIDEIISWE